MRNLVHDKEYVNNPSSVLQMFSKQVVIIRYLMTDEQINHNSNIGPNQKTHCVVFF